MSNRRILISMAHPDDESFGSGGLIARYVDEGADVYLICATNGDVGTMTEETMQNRGSKSEVRLEELACAAKVLGLKEVFTLGYKDSGMMGSADNEDPNSLWYNWNHSPDTVTERVVEIIRQIQPQVIITFNRYGGYGHPDHIAIQQATVKAFELAAQSSYSGSDLPPYQAQKVYFTNVNRLMVRIGIWRARMKGLNPRKLGRNNDIDLVAVLENAEPTNTRINVVQYMDIWMQANACHTSQQGGSLSSIPAWVRNWIGSKQSLSRFYPAPNRHTADETDLFQGVTEKEIELNPVP